MSKTIPITIVLLSVLSLHGFANAEDKQEVFQTETGTITLEKVATELTVPWGFTFLPDGNALVGEEQANGVAISKAWTVAVFWRG